VLRTVFQKPKSEKSVKCFQELGHWVKLQMSAASNCILKCLRLFHSICHHLSLTHLCLYCRCWQLAAGATGSSNQRGMLTNLARTIADQSEVSSKFFCHICNACLSSKTSLVTHIKGSHLAASMFTCDQCGASFKWYMQLHRHRRRYHGDSTDNHDNDYLPQSDPQWWYFHHRALKSLSFLWNFCVLLICL